MRNEDYDTRESSRNSPVALLAASPTYFACFPDTLLLDLPARISLLLQLLNT